jgi:hypothetical protein
MAAEYRYATGDLINKPNSYFYTPYQGIRFLDYWRNARSEVLACLPEPVPPKPASCGPISFSAIDLLEHAIAGDIALRDAFVKKFEIFKRIHSQYDESLKAVSGSDIHDFALYLRATDLFEKSYRATDDVRYLNVLLKCLDTLCAYHDVLGDELGARLAWHIENEFIHINFLRKSISCRENTN